MESVECKQATHKHTHFQSAALKVVGQGPHLEKSAPDRTPVCWECPPSLLPSDHMLSSKKPRETPQEFSCLLGKNVNHSTFSLSKMS